ncbi:MAG: bifunctional aspartate kinase/homoserine dehydrogenase I [Saprospiraceae bacterium]
MKILKFGGSSVGTPQRIENILNLLETYVNRGDDFSVVFSAFSGITDQLIALGTQASEGDENYKKLLNNLKIRHIEAAEYLLSHHSFLETRRVLDDYFNTLGDMLRGVFLVREASARTMDYILSFGERLSNTIIADAAKEKGMNAAFLDARECIKTNKDYGAAKVNYEVTDQLIQAYFVARPKQIQIITGFIGSDMEGVTTTLGRGGSDYTAAIFAGALQAEVLEIWTDVDGVLTSDPRKVQQAFTIPKLSYNEAMEMSHFGAKVIYPPTIQPALRKHIPIYIKNTFNPEFVGTLIHSEYDDTHRSPIKGISSMSGLCILLLEGSGMMGVPGVSGRMFAALGREKVNVILITQASSEHSICIAIDEKDKVRAQEAVNHEFSSEISEGLINPSKIESNLTVIAVIGEQMKNVPGVAGKLFEALGKNGINVIAIAQGSSELNISFVIHASDEAKALNAIHDAYFLSGTKTVHLFMIGVGLIGKTLIDQINNHKDLLREQNGIELKICGLANSKTMAFDDKGIDTKTWSQVLQSSNAASEPQRFVENMIAMNLSNSIFIDSTADQVIPSLYPQILEASITVATPNKIGASSAYTTYSNLKALARKHNVQYLFETNVGAGLPVISTLRNLIQSGDKILNIEAVLSGSVSYIFNNFDGSRPFSDLVLEAKEKGFTEPDPREDLSGADVSRKITILAREAGYITEIKDVIIDPILPSDCMDAPSIDDFFKALIQADTKFKERLDKAQKNGSRMRFIASATAEGISCGIKEVDAASPFYNLAGSDNMIVFTTERYKNRPLVIRGPGAGAEVTAAGIFAEIINASHG